MRLNSMGTPAFPNLGEHCSVDACRQIDFLPFTCDSCSKVFCSEHWSCTRHQCPKANKDNVTVVVCPLCAKGVHLIGGEDPDITWESHVNTECDPTNYDKVSGKKKCPVPRCKDTLTFSNSIRCKDCTLEHCLKHRFGPDHSCPGPKKPETGFPFRSLLSISRKEESKNTSSTSSPRWTSSLFRAASSVRATAEAGMAKLGGELNQVLQRQSSSRSTRHNSSTSTSTSQNTSRLIEQCPQCNLRFSSVADLINHVEKVHERNGVMKVSVDLCPNCNQGFRDPVSLVEHVEREHSGVSKA